MPTSESTRDVIKSHARDPGLKHDTHWTGDYELLFFAEVRLHGYMCIKLRWVAVPLPAADALCLRAEPGAAGWVCRIPH